jgi:hypothetical protein
MDLIFLAEDTTFELTQAHPVVGYSFPKLKYLATILDSSKT